MSVWKGATGRRRGRLVVLQRLLQDAQHGPVLATARRDGTQAIAARARDLFNARNDARRWVSLFWWVASDPASSRTNPPARRRQPSSPPPARRHHRPDDHARRACPGTRDDPPECPGSQSRVVSPTETTPSRPVSPLRDTRRHLPQPVDDPSRVDLGLVLRHHRMPGATSHGEDDPRVCVASVSRPRPGSPGRTRRPVLARRRRRW